MSREDGSHPPRVLAIMHHKDAGPGVFAGAIARAGAELDEWLLPDRSRPPRDPHEYTAVVALGAAAHVDQTEEHPWLERERELLDELVRADVPVLGVCLGAELLAQATGGDAVRAPRPEIGWFEVEVDPAGAEDPLLGQLAPRFEAFGWHSYELIPPEHASVLARSEACIQAFRVGDRAWGIQFHSEVTHEDLLGWIDDARSDPDANGLDTEALRRQTELSIERWNELGREMAERFVAQATRATR